MFAFHFLVGIFCLAASLMVDSNVEALGANSTHKLPSGFVYLHEYFEKVIKPSNSTVEQIREHLRYGMLLYIVLSCVESLDEYNFNYIESLDDKIHRCMICEMAKYVRDICNNKLFKFF